VRQTTRHHNQELHHQLERRLQILRLDADIDAILARSAGLSHKSTRLRDASDGSSDAASAEVADAEGDNYGQCSEGQLTQSRVEQWPTGEPTDHHASGEQHHSCYRQRDRQGA